MSTLYEIIDIVRDISGLKKVDAESDIFRLGIVGGDFHEMIEKYAERYKVDMTEYLWYFHTDEEGQSFGSLFFKPPYKRVEIIPVTPQLLSDFAEKKKWSIAYPEHKLPNRLIDLIINSALLIIVILILLGLWIF